MPTRNFPHQLGISEALHRRYAGNGALMREVLYFNAPPEAVAPEPEPEPAPPAAPEPTPLSGTLIVAARRTRCPKCSGIVERNTDAVMMDGTEYGAGTREAFHVECAVARGWRRS